MIVLACGFLAVMDFVLTPQDYLAMSLKSIPTNSFPLSRLIFSGQGHLFSHVCSKMSAAVTARSLSHLAILNHPAAGSIIVTAFKIKSSCLIFIGHFFPFCSFSMGGLFAAQGSVEAAHKVSQGLISASFGGKCPCFHFGQTEL